MNKISLLFWQFLGIVFICIILAGCPPGTETPPDDQFIVGKWVITDITLPDSPVYEFTADGIIVQYSDYTATTQVDAFIYSLNENTLSVNGSPAIITIVDDDHFWISETDKSISEIINRNTGQRNQTRYTPGADIDFYRIGTEPGGHYDSIFDKTATVLSEGVSWTSGSIDLPGDWVLYSFTAPSSSNYMIEWDAVWDGSGTYTADVVASCYESDQSTMFFENIEDGYTTGQAVSSDNGEVIYLSIRGYMNSMGTFGVRIRDVGPGTICTIETFPNGGGSNADTTITLYDSSLDELGFDDDIDGYNYYSSINNILLPSGDYYIDVYSYGDGYYSLQVSTTGGGGSSSATPAQDAGEDDDSVGEAVLINLDTVYDRYIDDSDWFTFTIP